MIRPSRPPPGQRAPVSMDVELRHIIATANQCHSELSKFRGAHRLPALNGKKIKAVVAETMKILELNDVDGMEELRQSVRADRKKELMIRKKPDYDQLEALCQKAQEFEQGAEVRRKLGMTVKNHLCKYCVSFSEQAAELDIKCVKDYDEHIDEYRKQLEEKGDRVRELEEKYQTVRTPFVDGFTQNAEEVNQIMDEVTTVDMEVCELVKQWAHEDKAYPQKLWDEIIEGNVVRGRLLEDVKKLRRRREELMHQVQRREAVRDKAHDKLDTHRREKKKTKDSKEVVGERLDREERNLGEVRRDYKENEQRIKDRKNNSPRFLDMLWNKSAKLSEDLQRVEEKVDTLKKQHGRLLRMIQEYEDKIHELQKDADVRSNELHVSVDRMNDVNKELNVNNVRLQQREAKIAMAKKIRQMKLSPEVLRKLHYAKLASNQGERHWTGYFALNLLLLRFGYGYVETRN